MTSEVGHASHKLCMTYADTLSRSVAGGGTIDPMTGGWRVQVLVGVNWPTHWRRDTYLVYHINKGLSITFG